MVRVAFDKDVRAGFGYAIDEIIKGICELWEIDPQKLKEYDQETIDSMPDGSEALFAILYSLTAFLFEPDDKLAADLMALAAIGLEPAVLHHLGIGSSMVTPRPREDDKVWN